MQTIEPGLEGLAGSVCDRINLIDERVTKFQQKLFPALSKASAQGTFRAKAHSALRFLSVHLMACETIFQVHHDLLDAAGRCSELQRLTRVQDRIGECIELIDVFMEATND
jgi:hypothetical protein